MGHIKIDRKLFENYLWTERRPRTRFEAWLDLIQLVSFSEENKNTINGVTVTWNRGEFPISYSFLSSRWIWSIRKVRTFLNGLKNDKMIVTKTTNKMTILTLCNYALYQDVRQAKGQAKDKQDDRQMAGIKEGNNNISNNIYRTFPPSLEDIQKRMTEREIISFSAEAFFSHYSANGWMVGKNKMKDWDAALTYWNQKNKTYENTGRNTKQGAKSINMQWVD